ncbi:hypothetical protein FYZ48_19215 [Gimesia chilikensis]|uniref:hypothetical protein n=1 Tax=Gimesia chilikensis TaxID=2605989 RepID=UPI0011EEF297|nr:hypothetical protein [Gimesia chilikensis]KAA0134975.1 hypothetical protein FYZ48_19215 [Gimesia chilikensis]
MRQAELIRFLEALGADVVVRRYKPDEPETIAVLVGRLPESDSPVPIPGWEDAVYLQEATAGWSIGYIQTGKTRPLQDEELKSLLTVWIRERDYRLFADYELE